MINNFAHLLILIQYFCVKICSDSREWDFYSSAQFYLWSSMYFSLHTQMLRVLEAVDEFKLWELCQISYHNSLRLLQRSIATLLCFFHLQENLFFTVFAIFISLNYLRQLLPIHFHYLFYLQSFLNFERYFIVGNYLSYKDPVFFIEFKFIKIKFLIRSLNSQVYWQIKNDNFVFQLNYLNLSRNFRN